MTYTAVNTAPPTRVTLLDATGAGVIRWTLQDPQREGRVIRWVPEGKLAELGSGTGFSRRWSHHGFRLGLGMKWGLGLLSSRESWSDGAWSTPTVRPTAEAHCEILDWAAGHIVRVEPFVGQPMPAFLALATEDGPRLQDTGGIVHHDLVLNLLGRHLVRSVTVVRAINGGWGIGPWGLMPWGY